jgi:hypothetical protein
MASNRESLLQRRIGSTHINKRKDLIVIVHIDESIQNINIVIILCYE